nr:LysR family transcriptional regulator [Conexibacter arvalis]
MDLRKLEHFTAVAEEQSFTRAAKRLHLTQQALSQSIRQFERELGTPLLARSSRRVELTAAGRALLVEARALIAAAVTARERVRAAASGARPMLRVGRTPAVSGEQVAEITRTLLGVVPDITFSVRQLYPSALADALARGEIDLGLSRSMSAPDGFASVRIGGHPLRIALSARHRLAGRGRLRLIELADDRLIVFGEPTRSAYANHLIDLCRQAGFEPRAERTPMQGTPPITSIHGDDQFAFVTDPPGPALGGQVVVVALDPEPHAPVRALFNRRAVPPLVAELLERLGVAGLASDDGEAQPAPA